MNKRPALALSLFCGLTGCAAAPKMQPDTGIADVAPILAERELSLYAQHQTIVLPARAPATTLGVEAPDTLQIRALVLTYDNGDRVKIATKTPSRVDLPSPARPLLQVELLYASDAPPDTYARIRLLDLSTPVMFAPTIAASR